MKSKIRMNLKTPQAPLIKKKPGTVLLIFRNAIFIIFFLILLPGYSLIAGTENNKSFSKEPLITPEESSSLLKNAQSVEKSEGFSKALSAYSEYFAKAVLNSEYKNALQYVIESISVVDEAESYLTSIVSQIQKYSDDADSHYSGHEYYLYDTLGLLMELSGKFEQAAEYYINAGQAVSSESKYKKVSLKAVRLFSTMGMEHKVEEWADDILETDAETAKTESALRLLSVLAYSQEKYEIAKNFMDTILICTGKDILSAESLYLMHNILTASGNAKEAEAYAEKLNKAYENSLYARLLQSEKSKEKYADSKIKPWYTPPSLLRIAGVPESASEPLEDISEAGQTHNNAENSTEIKTGESNFNKEQNTLGIQGYFQLGAYRIRENAEYMLKDVRDANLQKCRIAEADRNGQSMFLLLYPVSSNTERTAIEKKLLDNGFSGFFVKNPFSN